MTGTVGTRQLGKATRDNFAQGCCGINRPDNDAARYSRASTSMSMLGCVYIYVLSGPGTVIYCLSTADWFFTIELQEMPGFEHPLVHFTYRRIVCKKPAKECRLERLPKVFSNFNYGSLSRRSEDRRILRGFSFQRIFVRTGFRGNPGDGIVGKIISFASMFRPSSDFTFFEPSKNYRWIRYR